MRLSQNSQNESYQDSLKVNILKPLELSAFQTKILCAVQRIPYLGSTSGQILSKSEQIGWKVKQEAQLLLG